MWSIYVAKSSDFVWGFCVLQKEQGHLRSGLCVIDQEHVWDQLFTVDTIWNIGETGDIYCETFLVIVNLLLKTPNWSSNKTLKTKNHAFWKIKTFYNPIQPTYWLANALSYFALKSKKVSLLVAK